MIRTCRAFFTPFLLLGTLFLTTSCAHSGKKSDGVPRTSADSVPSGPQRKTRDVPSKNCLFFCDEIAGYAAEFGHTELSETLCRIATCETGKKCRAKIVSPTGKYRGPFQFSKASWRHNCSVFFTQLNLDECRQSSGMQNLRCATACSAEMISKGKIASWPHCGKAEEAGPDS